MSAKNGLMAKAQRRAAPVSRRAVAVKAALQFPALPYAADALEPTLSKESFEYHYGALLQGGWERDGRDLAHSGVWGRCLKPAQGIN